MRYEGMFFDLFGTLFAYGDMRAAWSDWLSALHDGLTEAGCHVPRDTLAKQCEGILAKPEPPWLADGSTVFERRMRALCGELRLALPHDRVLNIAERCIVAWQCHVSLDPNAVSVLEKLKADRKLALISNFDHPPHVASLLAQYRLGQLFDAVIVSGG